MNVGTGRLTSTTSRRYWDWNPSNDRDFTGLPITTISANPSRQDQYTQELRYSAATGKLDYVVGLFGFLNRWNDTMATALEDTPAALAGRTIGPHGWEPGEHG